MKTLPLRRPLPLRLEVLEDRTLPSVAPSWSSFAGDMRHAANSSVASQPLSVIRWQTAVDLNPQYTNGNLDIHYGSPLVTGSNTVIVPVKIGANGGFQIQAFNGSNGALMWTLNTDYILPPHNGIWTQSFSPVLTAQGQLIYPGAGGTVYVATNLDSTLPVVTAQRAFYGIGNYTHAGFDNSVFISTPLTTDSFGDIFFGVTSNGANPLGVVSGMAELATNPFFNNFIDAATAAGDAKITEVMQNCAPALSIDQNSLYFMVSAGDGQQGYLVDLSLFTFAPTKAVKLFDPDGNLAALPDSGTASPTVGPDGNVFVGVRENPYPYNAGRGWLLQFSGDLKTQFATGAFGWDATASIVPKTMMRNYVTNSPYLIMTNYDNYAEVGGTGQNRLAILDPGVFMVDPITGQFVMKVVSSVLDPIPNFPLPGVKEWSTNSAVVDPFTDSVLVNSQDGNLYRWNIGAGLLTQQVQLNSGSSEANTPTLVGTDGTVYAINNGTLFAVGLPDVATSTRLTASKTSLIYGQQDTFTARVTATNSTFPKGLVTFLDGTTELGTVTVNQFGIAILVTTTDLVAGPRSITAVFDGGPGYYASTSNTVLVTVSPVTNGNNIDVSNYPGYQGETTIAINPLNPLNMIAGSNNLGPNGFTNAFYTFDGGQTWIAVPLGQNGDPGVAFDNQGNAYFTYIDSNFGIGVKKSTDGGKTWGPNIEVAANIGFGIQDKPAIAIGPDALNPGQQRIYIAWDNNSAGDVVQVVSSGDGGASWTAPNTVDGFANEFFTAPAVGPQGQFYLTFTNFATPGVSKLMFTTSMDDGNTFSNPTVIATSKINTFNPVRYTVPAQNTRGISPNPGLVVEQSGPNAGRLYFVYNTATGGVHNNTDVMLVASDDGGNTWTALGPNPIKVNNDTGLASQFFPTIGIDPTNNNVVVAWYDTRNSPTNINTDIYFQPFTSGGVAIGGNVKVTTAQSNETNSFNNNPNQYGDYMAIAATGGLAFPVWTDHRNNSGGRGSEEIYTDLHLSDTVGAAPSALADRNANVPTTGVLPTATQGNPPLVPTSASSTGMLSGAAPGKPASSPTVLDSKAVMFGAALATPTSGGNTTAAVVSTASANGSQGNAFSAPLPTTQKTSNGQESGRGNNAALRDNVTVLGDKNVSLPDWETMSQAVAALLGDRAAVELPAAAL